MAKKELDMRTLYILYEEATKNLMDETNTPELLKVLQTIQDAANLDTVLSMDEDPLCTNINTIYNSKQTKEKEQIIKNLSEFIEKANTHNLGWQILEPRVRPKIAKFLDKAKIFAKDLLQSILRKKRTIEQERKKTIPLKSKKHPEDTPEEKMNTVDSLLAILGFGKRDRND